MIGGEALETGREVPRRRLRGDIEQGGGQVRVLVVRVRVVAAVGHLLAVAREVVAADAALHRTRRGEERLRCLPALAEVEAVNAAGAPWCADDRHRLPVVDAAVQVL